MPWLVPRLSWRRFLSAIFRHSWLGFPVGGGGCSSPLLAEGTGCGSPPLLAGVCWQRWCVVACHTWLRVSGLASRHSRLGSAGRGGGFFRGWGFPVLCVLVARRVLVCALCVCGGGVGVGVSSVCVQACVAGCGGLFPWLGLAAGVSLVGGVVGVWAVPPTPGGGSRVRFPATSGWLALPVVLGVPRHSWLRAPGAVPCHSWLGSAGGGGVWLLAPLGVVLVTFRRHSWLGSAGRGVGRLRWVGWGFLVVCVFVARCVRAWCLCWCVCRAFVVAWVWVCLPCVLVCVCVCVWVCGWGQLGLAAGVSVGVGVVGVCRGWSLATPGGGS